MKRQGNHLFWAVVLAVALLALAGCQAAEDSEILQTEDEVGADLTLELDQDGCYLGFEGMDPKDPEKGSYVIRGGSVVKGSHLMQAFLDQVTEGKDGAVRIVTYALEEMEISDLFYTGGVYRVFHHSDGGEGSPAYPYLLYLHNPLTSYTGNNFLVLTDDVDLLYDRVLFDPVYSSLPPFTMVTGMFQDKQVDWSAVLSKEGWPAVEGKLTFDSFGRYLGFRQLDEDYTPQKAYVDGCYVNIEYEEFLGAERFARFLQQAEAGEEAYLRIVSFHQDEDNPEQTRIHYGDLFYEDGFYRYFSSSDEGGGLRAESLLDEPYRYCRLLETQPWDEEGAAVQWYVLTDDLDLTMDDIYQALLSSQSDARDKLPPYVMITGIGL